MEAVTNWKIVIHTKYTGKYSHGKGKARGKSDNMKARTKALIAEGNEKEDLANEFLGITEKGSLAIRPFLEEDMEAKILRTSKDL